MTQYIDKDALVAEIDSLLDKGRYHEEYDCAYRDGNNGALYALKDKLDTIEVKEVDINKEISQFIDSNFEGAGIGHKLSLRRTAKYFFELGLVASNPLTVKDIKKIYHLVNEVSDDLGVRAMYMNIYQETLKRYNAQKGE